jgi:hypothetical protein
MSYHVYFAFSTGLKDKLLVPAGTKTAIIDHVAAVEADLTLECEELDGGRRRWVWGRERREAWKSIKDNDLCRAVLDHNRWVRWLYECFAAWSENPVADGEELTPADAATFWHALEILSVPIDRWSIDYYRDRMEHLYEVMRGRESEGVTMDLGAPLTPEQAGDVIRLFSEYLDSNDIRLEVPRERDYLASSYYGEYEWCSRCGAVTNEDAEDCRSRGCPAKEDWDEEEQGEGYEAGADGPPQFPRTDHQEAN